MLGFHRDNPSRQSVNGVYALLTTPVRAILRSWNDANPRDKSYRWAGSTRRRSYERLRKQPIEVPLSFSTSNDQNYTYATSRQRQWKGSNRSEGSMSPPNKKLKTQHQRIGSADSPWATQTWLQESIRDNVEQSSSRQSTNGRSYASAYSNRSDFATTKSRTNGHGPSNKYESPQFRSFGRSRFAKSSPTAALSRTPKEVRRFTGSPDSSPDGHSGNRTYKKIGIYNVAMLKRSQGTPPATETNVEQIPEPAMDEVSTKHSKYSAGAVQAPAVQRPTPPPSPGRKPEEASSIKDGVEDHRHSGYLRVYTDIFRGFSPTPSPEPERRPIANGWAKTPAKPRGSKRSLFGNLPDPIQNSPGAFPLTESEGSEGSLEERRVRDTSNESDSDSSNERPQRFGSPDVSHRPHSKHKAEPRRHSMNQSYHLTPGFIGGAKRFVIDTFLSPIKATRKPKPRSTELPDLSNLNLQSRRPKSERWTQDRIDRKTREQKVKEEREAALAAGEYALVELSDEWDRKVRQAVRQGTPDGKYAPTDFARVVPQYANPPQRSKWLNDAVINDYVALVARHGNKDDRKDQVPSFAALSSFFYSKIEQDPKNAPPSWTRRAKIAGKALLDCEMIFIPINDGMHWTLCVIEPKGKRTVTMYNSMGHGRNDHHIRAVSAWVGYHLGAAFIEDEWTLNSRGISPQQNNSDDCGVFTCTTARQLMLGQFEKTPYDHTIMAVQRKRMIAELVNNGLIKADEDT